MSPAGSGRSPFAASVTDDWFDLIAALLDAGARFLVVGAHALAVHGIPRATQDLDIWIEPTEENAGRVWRALAAFGAPTQALGIAKADLVRPNTVMQFGAPPNRVDLLTAISGVPDFGAAWTVRQDQDVRGRSVPFLGRDAFVANKRASGRLKDLADIESLGEKR